MQEILQCLERICLTVPVIITDIVAYYYNRKLLLQSILEANVTII
jgi:hypothetical protein